MTFTDADLIYSYSRAQALADGVLVEVTDSARTAGFTLPVDLTCSLWAHIETIPENSGEDAAGRLWDVLALLALKVRALKPEDDTDTILFSVLMTNAETTQRERLELKAVVGPGDDAEPVLTIMFPHED